MIHAHVRRMLVRDDGSGRSRPQEVRIADFSDQDAIVILGDPGMGKTTLFKQLAGDDYVKVRQFIAAPSIPSGGTLYLDSLDEYRRTASAQDVAVELARTLTGLNKPKFRLSCRAADWFGSLDQEVLTAASRSGHIVVLELLPLSDDEIVEAASQRLRDEAETFVVEARSAGLGGLLRNPQTLGLIVSAWSGAHQPKNKFEAYALGISELVKEANPGHITRGAQSSGKSLREAAGAIAAVLLLSDSDGILRVDCLDVGSCVDLSNVPYDDNAAVETTLKRRVFTSPRHDYFEFVHRTIEEFLAAEDLSNRIAQGLPIDRVLALMCGIDGSPVASLRGLYAWLICRLGERAKAYVDRDPYAVVTYGDASVLAPSVQRALWHSLRQLRDPWFLSGEERGQAFRKLANRDTAAELLAILLDPDSSPHLQVAVLESITHVEEDLGLLDAVYEIVLRPDDNVWLRSVALKAFVHLTNKNPVVIAEVDRKLSRGRKDCFAADVRVELLNLTIDDPGVAHRALAVLRHVAACEEGRRVFGPLFRLGQHLPESEIEEVLDGAHLVLKGEKRNYEIESVFATLLMRRLNAHTPLKPVTVAKWLRSVLRHRDHDEKLLDALKTRLALEPELFSQLFGALTRLDRHYVWQMLPPSIWPIPPAIFFLDQALRESNVAKAADFFRMYLAWFPSEGGTVGLAEAGFDLVEARPKLAKQLGKWNECAIEQWREEEWQRRSSETEKRAATREATIQHLMPRLADIAAGNDQRALEWATGIYFGYYIDVDGNTPSDRFREAANAEIESACMQGFVQFLEREDIPTKEQVVERWCGNQIPFRHSLLCLSLYLRETSGLGVPSRALPACLAAALTNLTGDKIEGFHSHLKAWSLRQAVENAPLTKAILVELWLTRRGLLPGFHELSTEKSLQIFVANVAAEVLRSPQCDDYVTRTLVPVVLAQSPNSIEIISADKLADPCLFGAARGVWQTAVYLINPIAGLAGWRELQTQPDDALWEGIELIAGRSRPILAQQRSEIIAAIGRRFPPADHPATVWSGNRNTWDASSFVGKQIEILAADTSLEASERLQALEDDASLAGYRDFIRHNREQQVRQRRELSFVVATPEQIHQALMNGVPASPDDLLAYVADHIEALSRELAHTQKERYRAYWNEEGRKLISPKHEEICSGLFASDLQARMGHELIATVEHHMVDDKECDVVVLQGADRFLPIEVKHHFHRELWTAWKSQLEGLYARDAAAGGRGIYLILWSGVSSRRWIHKPPSGTARPTSAEELQLAIQSLIPRSDRNRLRVLILDIAPPSGKP
jgi:hypothetical protein